ncbi:MAG TPA: dihydroneopterin aldolase [Ilumatobacteraceae bacterium]|nr:dihydroneopterin aldolase [Ilumatobacteraceae bacterium]
MATPDPTSAPNDARRARSADPDRIIVNGLVVDASIGVHDFEREAPQRVRFDIAIETVDDYADQVQTTGSYVSYADIVEFVLTRAASGEHIELVETWAEDIAVFALRNELAHAVHVTVQKLDIFDTAEGVGIAIERRRPQPDPT